MERNPLNFHCTSCKHEWWGPYIPLYCPNCEGVLGIAIVIGGDKEDDV